jgi:signal transduction histidine kinase
MKSLPIRLRLTVWYFVMFATAAGMLSLGSAWMLRRTLDATVYQDLQERIDDVAVQLHQFGAQHSPDQAQLRFTNFYRDRDDGKWLQILDEHGRWIFRSARFISAARTLPGPESFPRKPFVQDFVQGIHHVRALSVRVVVDGHAYSVETGISMKKPNALLHDFSFGLLLLMPAVLLPAAIGGHVMSRKALAPVAAIAREARRITDRNLDTRLPVSETHDELSHLSITLNNMLERIDVAFRSVREFTANASHELRTPLARLRTETEIALFRPRESAEYRQALERVHQDSVDMSGLVENLLTLARAEAGNEVIRLAPVNLTSLLSEVAEEWRPIVERLSLQLRTVGLEQDPRFALGDKLSLLRLFRILLDNACKFSEAPGVVTIRMQASATAVMVAIEDSGIGIAPEHQKRIFDRFFRVDGDGGRYASGSGLGLSLAAWIAEQHKTSITVESALARGSSFQIKLVRVASGDDPDSSFETAESKSPESIVTSAK